MQVPDLADYPEWVVTRDLCEILDLPRHTVLRYGSNGWFERRALDRDDPRWTSGHIAYEYRLPQCAEAMGCMPNRQEDELDRRVVWMLARRGFHSAELGRAFGVDARKVRYRLTRSGYEYERCLRLTKAPCIDCGRVLDTDRLNDYGRCWGCEP